MPEPIVRRELEARGRVQRVGYRDFVEETARTLGVRGTVANDDRDERLVRIVAQGSAGTLEEFVRAISGRHGFADAEVRLVKEGEADAALVEFVKLRGPEGKEMLERADQSVLLLGRIFETGVETLGVGKETLAETRKVGEKVDRLGAEVRGVGAEVRDGNRRLEKSLDRMHADMSARFDRVDRSYGSIGKTLLRIDKNLEKLTKALLLLAQEAHRAAVSTRGAPLRRTRGKKGRRT